MGEFIDTKVQKDRSKIPEYRFFNLSDTTKDIIWKIVMSRKNTIVSLDQDGKILATIGLL